jgi:hypothetical protein
MKRSFVLLSLCALTAFFQGCGPMRGPSPLPERLDDEGQKSIDEAWDRAFTPVNHLDRQGLLDGLVITQAYQVGVDKLAFRSEKKLTAGTVVMEIAFDRSNPAGDRFEVTVYDRNDTKVRQERYTRQEIDVTCKQLADPHRQELERKKAAGEAAPQEVKELERIEARNAAIEAIFPRQDKNEAHPGAPGN